jgi:heme exporter protein C
MAPRALPGSARPRLGGADFAFYALVAVTTGLYLFLIHYIFLTVPTEKTMGIVQKIFYFHVPSAYSMYVGATACLAGSVMYLVKPSDVWDALARAGAEAAVVFGAIMLTTGPLWAAKAWGYYWTWDPRLTTALLSFLVYFAYLVLRAFAGDGEGERKFSAALGILGAANLPIIHFSVKKWSGQHPEVITGNGGGLGDPRMYVALGLGFLAFTLLSVALIWARTRVAIAESRLARAEEDAIDLDLDDRNEG